MNRICILCGRRIEDTSSALRNAAGQRAHETCVEDALRLSQRMREVKAGFRSGSANPTRDKLREAQGGW